MKFNITTFNLRLNHTADKENAWPYRLDAVVKYIKESQPLVMGTQEVLEGMLRDLMNNLQDYNYIGITRAENEEANPILFNNHILEVREQGTFWLSKTPTVPNSIDFDSACRRICTWAEFMFKKNRNMRFRVFNTHLDHISTTARIEGIKIILDFITNKEKEEVLPTILTGDFNATIQDEVVKLLKDSNIKFGKQSVIDVFDYLPVSTYGPTFHHYGKITKGDPIDYIFVSNNIRIHKTNIDRQMVLGKFTSDHYPVTTEIELVL